MRDKKRAVVREQMVEKRYVPIRLKVAENARGNKIDKKRIYHRHVDFTEIENAFFYHAADFRWGGIIQFSTVSRAEQDQAKITNDRKKPFLPGCLRGKVCGTK